MAASKRRKILVLFYSLTGKTGDYALEIAAGAEEVVDTDVEIKRVPELIPAQVFEKNPVLKEKKEDLERRFAEATEDDLIKADGIIFGTPVHFGSFASQLKQFIDQLSSAWLKGHLVNKPAAFFCTAGSLHGGEEAALISLMIPIFNLGMIPVGIPYPIQGESPDFDSGSPYGAIYVTGHKGEKKISDADKKIARLLGRRLATMAQVFSCGCEACKVCWQLTRKEK